MPLEFLDQQIAPRGLMFHHFRDDRFQFGQNPVSAEQLDAMISIIMPVSADRWINERAGVCITFDDTLLSQYEIALPVLEKYNLKAFFFIYTSVLVGEMEMLEVYRKFITSFKSIDEFYSEFFLHTEHIDMSWYSHADWSKYPFYTENDTRFRYIRDRIGPRYAHVMARLMQNIDLKEFTDDIWLSARHIKDLHSKGHIIGMHGNTHPLNMAGKPIEEQIVEYRKNSEILHDITGEKPTTMSHPSNSYSADTIKVLKGLGVDLGFKADMCPRQSEFDYPRMDQANITRRSHEDYRVYI